MMKMLLKSRICNPNRANWLSRPMTENLKLNRLAPIWKIQMPLAKSIRMSTITARRLMEATLSNYLSVTNATILLDRRAIWKHTSTPMIVRCQWELYKIPPMDDINARTALNNLQNGKVFGRISQNRMQTIRSCWIVSVVCVDFRDTAKRKSMKFGVKFVAMSAISARNMSPNGYATCCIICEHIQAKSHSNVQCANAVFDINTI